MRNYIRQYYYVIKVSLSIQEVIITSQNLTFFQNVNNILYVYSLRHFIYTKRYDIFHDVPFNNKLISHQICRWVPTLARVAFSGVKNSCHYLKQGHKADEKMCRLRYPLSRIFWKIRAIQRNPDTPRGGAGVCPPPYPIPTILSYLRNYQSRVEDVLTDQQKILSILKIHQKVLPQHFV